MEKDLTVEHRGLKCSHKLNVPGREEREEEEVLKKGERGEGRQELATVVKRELGCQWSR